MGVETIARKLMKSIVRIFHWLSESYKMEYTSAFAIVKGISRFVDVEGLLI
jgi:hypothetical protein